MDGHQQRGRDALEPGQARQSAHPADLRKAAYPAVPALRLLPPTVRGADRRVRGSEASSTAHWMSGSARSGCGLDESPACPDPPQRIRVSRVAAVPFDEVT